MDKYKQLAIKLKARYFSAELKQALTHKSFYPKGDERNGNSRYVFAGMFAFKGVVAHMLLQRISGTGTQLQHALGKMFKHEQMQKLFAYFDLDRYIRHDADFQADAHNHVFTYGLLGWIVEHASEDVVKEFITRHFILPHSNDLQPKSKNSDMKAQCNQLSQIVYGCKVKLTIQESEKGFRATVVAGDDCTLSDEQSTSYRYARQKALKVALHALISAVDERDRSCPDYDARRQRLNDIMQQKYEAERAEKTQQYSEKKAKKKRKVQEIKSRKKNKAIAADIQRRAAKASAKRRKEQETLRAAEVAAKLANMSAKKRRHLQDKKK